jgi:hypothetical protein
MPSVIYSLPRGTRASLNARATANQLVVGQEYLITDEARTVVATAVNAYSALAKQSEIIRLTVSAVAPANPQLNDLWVDTN